MHPTRLLRLSRGILFVALLGTAPFIGTNSFAADTHTHTSKPFSGTKVNGGTVTHAKRGHTNTLTLSDDFKVPDTPDPHWQIVDAKGDVYLLQKLGIKGDKVNKTITLPEYIHNVAKVQIWCAFAETLPGEALFAPPVK